jgi:hypothetical protein
MNSEDSQLACRSVEAEEVETAEDEVRLFLNGGILRRSKTFSSTILRRPSDPLLECKLLLGAPFEMVRALTGGGGGRD